MNVADSNIVKCLHYIYYIHNAIGIMRRDVLGTQCGISKSAPGPSYFWGGEEAIPNSWPWHVLLRCTDTDTERNLVVIEQRDSCGGSIISENWVITAARCM